MNHTLSVLMLSLLPNLVMAAGGHADHQSHEVTALQSHEHEHSVGMPGKAAEVTRTIEVIMSDKMRFFPQDIDVQTGETVHFLVKNTGKVAHELVIGDMASLQEHAEMMRQMPEMEHAEPNMITLQPGQQGELLWKFAQAGNVDFTCLLPGHLEAGMKGQVQVK